MRNFLRTGLCIALFAASVARAGALPGDPFLTVKATALHKGFGVHCAIGEMSGTPFCTASRAYRGTDFNYSFHDDAGHVDYSESIWYNGSGFRFLNRGDSRVHDLLQTIYSESVARDFLNAKVVAVVGQYQLPHSHITFLRGRRFGYATGDGGGFSLTVYRASDLNREIQTARRCATMECGD